MAIFSEQLVQVGMRFASKTELLTGLVSMFNDVHVIDSKDRFLQAVQGREEIMSTGIGRGVALPHGRDISVRELKVVVCTLAEPLDFESLDQEPVSLVFMIAIPQAAGKQYMKVLGRISSFTREDSKREALLSCRTNQELFNAISEIEDAIQKDLANPAP